MTTLVEMKIETRTDGDLGAWRVIASLPLLAKLPPTAGDSGIELRGAEDMTTANRVPLTAALAGLATLRRRCAVELYTDSAYLAHGAASLVPVWNTQTGKAANFRASIRNEHLWDQLVAVASRHDVHWHWAKPATRKSTKLVGVTTTCKKCGSDIVWIRENGKLVAADAAGSLHATTCKRIVESAGIARPEIWGRTAGIGGSAVYAGATAPWDVALGDYREFTTMEAADPLMCENFADDSARITFDE